MLVLSIECLKFSRGLLLWDVVLLSCVYNSVSAVVILYGVDEWFVSCICVNSVFIINTVFLVFVRKNLFIYFYLIFVFDLMVDRIGSWGLIYRGSLEFVFYVLGGSLKYFRDIVVWLNLGFKEIFLEGIIKEI